MSLASGSSTPRRTDAEPASGRLTYVVDTSVLLSDPHALRRFAEHDVVLPLVVVTELEAKRHHRRAGLLRPDRTADAGRAADPAPPTGRSRCRSTTTGGTVHVELNHTDAALLLPEGFRLSDNDSRILAVALNYAAEGRDVTLVSKDLPMRVKAAAVGLRAQEYRAELAVSSGWTGMAEIGVTASAAGPALRHRPCSSLEEGRELPCHTGVVACWGPAQPPWPASTPDKDLQTGQGPRRVRAARSIGRATGGAGSAVGYRTSASSPSAAGPAPANRPWHFAPASRPCSNDANTPRSWCSGRCTRWVGRSWAICRGRRGRRWRRGLRPSSTPWERSAPRS